MHASDRDQGTLESLPHPADTARQGHVRLMIVHHPDVRRVGESAALASGVNPLGRAVPVFGERGLDGRFLSRAPVQLTVTTRQSLLIDPTQTRTQVRVGQANCTETIEVDADALCAGVSITLSRRVVLWAQWICEPAGPPVPGMIGRSDPMERLRREIVQVAAFDVACLIIGETGTGKELVAQAIHSLSPRRDHAFVALNMAALPASVAPAQLFGHAQGAFAGAERDTPGAFVTADGGTLFLDEIGACPLAVQAQLLRALESRSIHPIGGMADRTIDVRVVAATDVDLDAEVGAGRFRGPLFHRLSGYVLQVPPLRARSGDVGLLFQAFVTETLRAAGADARLIDAERPWIPTEIFERVLHADWPGNIREVRNVAQTLAVRIATIEGRVPADVIDDRLTRAPVVQEKVSYRNPKDIGEDELVAALAQNAYRIAPTAAALGVSRTTLYALIGLSTRVRTAASLTAPEIQAALSAGQSVAATAEALGVSAHALKLRMKALGLE